MAIPVPRTVVEFALLGPTHDRRQLQDSPILGDVWLSFAATPDETIELLIEPHWEESAGTVAIALDDAIVRRDDDDGADIAPLHGVVAARLSFSEVVKFVVPRTTWWNKRVTSERYQFLSGDRVEPASQAARLDQPGDPLARAVGAAMGLADYWRQGGNAMSPENDH
jgi:serine protease AprX